MLYGFVVGYAKDGFQQNTYRMVCSQFLKIGSDGSDMKLADLKVNWEETNGWNCQNDMIKFVNAAGGKDFMAKFFDYSKLNFGQKNALKALGITSAAQFTQGWYKIDNNSAPIWTECINERPLPFGDAVLALSGSTKAAVTTSGEVVAPVNKEIVYELTQNTYAIVGNCTPVALTLKDFKVNWNAAANGWNCQNDMVKFVNAAGGKDFMAKFYDYSKLNFGQKNALKALGITSADQFTQGWYKIDNNSAPIWTECVNDYPVAAGAGVLTLSGSSAATIKIPSAL